MANQQAGKALSEIPALKPYWGKPAVRNFRGEGGNVGIIEARLAPLSYSTNGPTVSTLLCGIVERAFAELPPRSTRQTAAVTLRVK
jgi:hypothetical protein